MIIYDICEMIGRHAIWFNQDEVFNERWWLVDAFLLPIHHISQCGIRYLTLPKISLAVQLQKRDKNTDPETNDMIFVPLETSFNFRLREL